MVIGPGGQLAECRAKARFIIIIIIIILQVKEEKDDVHRSPPMFQIPQQRRPKTVRWIRRLRKKINQHLRRSSNRRRRKARLRAGLQMEEEANKFLPCRPRFHQQWVPHLQTSSKADHFQPVNGNYTVSRKCPFTFFMNKSVKIQPVFIVFNRQNSDESWRVYNIFQHTLSVSTLPCEIQKDHFQQ